MSNCVLTGLYESYELVKFGKSRFYIFSSLSLKDTFFRAIWWNVLGIGGLLLICAYGGMVVFAYYSDCKQEHWLEFNTMPNWINVLSFFMFMNVVHIRLDNTKGGSDTLDLSYIVLKRLTIAIANFFRLCVQTHFFTR